MTAPYYQLSGGPGTGMFPVSNNPRPLWNRTGATLSRGAIVQLDESKADAASTTMSFGVSGSAFANVITPVTGDPLRVGTFFCYVGSADLVDDAEGLFLDIGTCDCDIEDGAVALVDVLTVQATRELDVNGTRAGQKCIAKALATRASGAALVPCFFNGYGFANIALA